MIKQNFSAVMVIRNVRCSTILADLYYRINCISQVDSQHGLSKIIYPKSIHVYTALEIMFFQEKSVSMK